jgi:hypothetical protein
VLPRLPRPSGPSAKATGIALAAGLLLTALSLLFVGLSPADAWREARFPNRYLPPQGDFRPVVVWDGNVGSRFMESFDIRTFLFPVDNAVVLIPMEGKGRGWSGPWYVDGRGLAWVEARRFDELAAIDPALLQAKLAWANRVVYNDRRALDTLIARLPALGRLPAVRFRPAAGAPEDRTVAAAAGLAPFAGLALRLAALMSCGALLASVLRRTWLAGAPPVTAWALSAGCAFSAMTVGAWALAEGMRFDPSAALPPALALLAAVSLLAPPPLPPAEPPLPRRALAALAASAALLASISSLGTALDGDIGRYLFQGRILAWFGGWPRDWFASAGMRGGVSNYPFGPGLFYGTLLDVVGYAREELLRPGWRFTALFRLNQAAFALLPFTAVLPLWDRFRRTGGAGPAIAAAVFLLSPACLGQALGGENLFWPLLMLLLAAPDCGGRRPVAAAALILSALALQKDEAILAAVLLALPARLLATGLPGVPARTARAAAAFALASAPLAIFKLRNLAGGFQSRNALFGPFTVDYLSGSLPDLPAILRAELGAVGPARLAFWILAAVALPLALARRRGAAGVAMRRLAACLAPPIVWTALFTLSYLFSNYVSRPVHAEQSFLRLSYPAVLVFCFSFLVWPPHLPGISRAGVPARART